MRIRDSRFSELHDELVDAVRSTAKSAERQAVVRSVLLNRRDVLGVRSKGRVQ